MLEKMRNIGIMAHIDAGKTTTTERILYYSGKIHKIGEIDDGAATMDFMQQEQDRGITIASAAITTQWKDYQVNIIDTPGHVDFTAEVERSLRVLDGAIAVICAVGWVQPQTETVWHQADKFNVPRICFVNKMDRIGADFYGAMENVRQKFNCQVVALEIPIGSGQDFDGVIDLLKMKEIHWDAATEGEKFTVSDISEPLLAKAQEWREKLIDTVASNDDELGELYLEGQEITSEQLITAVRKLTINRTLVPFLCGSSRHNQGIQPLMDAIIDFLPSPTEVPPAEAMQLKKHDETERITVPCDPNAKAPVGLVFKIQHDPNAGILCFVRMYAGKINTGTQIYNISKKKRERVNRILRVNANHMDQMDSVSAGDIAVFVGLKLAQTGDSVGSEGFPVLLESVKFPEPVISIAIEPETMSDRQKLLDTLEILSREDPTFTHKEDGETGQLVISGMGELHLDVLVTRIREDFKVQCRVGAPQVTYRESVTTSADYTERYSRMIAGKETTAGISMHVEPKETGSGNSYACTAKRGEIPDEIFEAIEQSVNSCFTSGIKLGYPCTDIAITVTDVSYDPLTATTFAFEAASAEAFDNVCSLAEPQMLEPVMAVDIECPSEFVGDAMSQITQRGGIISSMAEKTGGNIVYAQAPMAKMFGFSTNLRSVTQGRASFSMTFSHFQKK